MNFAWIIDDGYGRRPPKAVKVAILKETPKRLELGDRILALGCRMHVAPCDVERSEKLAWERHLAKLGKQKAARLEEIQDIEAEIERAMQAMVNGPSA